MVRAVRYRGLHRPGDHEPAAFRETRRLVERRGDAVPDDIGKTPLHTGEEVRHQARLLPRGCPGGREYGSEEPHRTPHGEGAITKANRRPGPAAPVGPDDTPPATVVPALRTQAGVHEPLRQRGEQQQRQPGPRPQRPRGERGRKGRWRFDRRVTAVKAIIIFPASSARWTCGRHAGMTVVAVVLDETARYPHPSYSAAGGVADGAAQGRGDTDGAALSCKGCELDGRKNTTGHNSCWLPPFPFPSGEASVLLLFAVGVSAGGCAERTAK